jgi:hypothetical protein
MTDSIHYRKMQAGTEEFAELQEFAKSFDHVITPHPNIVVYALYKNGRLFGYIDQVFVPTAYPAFHPEHTKPRDVVQVMNDWKTHSQLSGNPGYVGVPLDNNNGIGNFPESTMNKLGLTRLNRELYYPAF